MTLPLYSEVALPDDVGLIEGYVGGLAIVAGIGSRKRYEVPIRDLRPAQIRRTAATLPAERAIALWGLELDPVRVHESLLSEYGPKPAQQGMLALRAHVRSLEGEYREGDSVRLLACDRRVHGTVVCAAPNDQLWVDWEFGSRGLVPTAALEPRFTRLARILRRVEAALQRLGTGPDDVLDPGPESEDLSDPNAWPTEIKPPVVDMSGRPKENLTGVPMDEYPNPAGIKRLRAAARAALEEVYMVQTQIAQLKAEKEAIKKWLASTEQGQRDKEITKELAILQQDRLKFGQQVARILDAEAGVMDEMGDTTFRVMESEVMRAASMAEDAADRFIVVFRRTPVEEQNAIATAMLAHVENFARELLSLNRISKTSVSETLEAWKRVHSDIHRRRELLVGTGPITQAYTEQFDQTTTDSPPAPSELGQDVTTGPPKHAQTSKSTSFLQQTGEYLRRLWSRAQRALNLTQTVKQDLDDELRRVQYARQMAETELSQAITILTNMTSGQMSSYRPSTLPQENVALPMAARLARAFA